MSPTCKARGVTSKKGVNLCIIILFCLLGIPMTNMSLFKYLEKRKNAAV